jgi:hypothetical protein
MQRPASKLFLRLTPADPEDFHGMFNISAFTADAARGTRDQRQLVFQSVQGHVVSRAMNRTHESMASCPD